jgi:hypothetical protein
VTAGPAGSEQRDPVGVDELTILVNSTDGYADCWEPFMTLLAAYWPECPYRIVVNTERRRFEFPGMRVSTSRTWSDESSPRPTWSESLSRCLDGINSPVVLYLQDDYFLNGPVDVGTIERFVRIMIDEGRPHILVRELADAHYHPLPEHPELWVIPSRSPYLVSLQAGLWSRAALRSLLRPAEDPWQFERYGTLRARRSGLMFLCPDLDRWERSGQPLIPYEPTGIVRGRWYAPAVVDLFAEHGIEIDFSRRGFYVLDRRERFVRHARALTRRVAMRVLP